MELHRLRLHLWLVNQYLPIDLLRVVQYKDRSHHAHHYYPAHHQDILLLENLRKLHAHCHHVGECHLGLEGFPFVLFYTADDVFVAVWCHWSWT